MGLLSVGIREFKDVRAAANSLNPIVHCAAQVTVTTSLELPRTHIEINTLGALNAPEAARLNDAAILYFSTNKVCGDNVNRIPTRELETRYELDDLRYEQGMPEDFPVDNTGHSAYAYSKLARDLYV